MVSRWRCVSGCAALLAALALALAAGPRGASAEIYWGAFDPVSFTGLMDEMPKQASIHVVDQYVTVSLDVSYLSRIRDKGMIPLIELWPACPTEPWERWSLQSIASGSHDQYFARFANAARFWRFPFFLSFAPWMNKPGFSWSVPEMGSAADFVAAWRHVWSVFNSSDAANVNWVFSPVADSPTDSIAELYPGDQYVDWVGAESINRVSDWDSFEDRLMPTYAALQNFSASKPVIVTTGCAETEYEGDKAYWILQTMQNEVTVMPRIKAFVWRSSDNGPEEDLRIDSSKDSLDAFRTGIAGKYYSANYFSHLTGNKIQPLSPL